MDTGRLMLLAMRSMIRSAIKTARAMDDLHDMYADSEQYITARHTIRDYWHVYRVAMTIQKEVGK
jgi:hypothetical protein